MKNIIVREAAEPDGVFAKTISDEMEASAIARGSGISKKVRGINTQKNDPGEGHYCAD